MNNSNTSNNSYNSNNSNNNNNNISNGNNQNSNNYINNNYSTNNNNINNSNNEESPQHHRFSDFKEKIKKRSIIFEVESSPSYFQGGIIKYNRPKIVRKRRVYQKRNGIRAYNRDDEDLNHTSFIELSPISSSSNEINGNNDIILDESVLSSFSSPIDQNIINQNDNNNNNNNIRDRSNSALPLKNSNNNNNDNDSKFNYDRSKTLNSIKYQLNEQNKEKDQLEKELNEIMVKRTWKETFYFYLGLGELFTPSLYKAASMELIGSALFLFMSLSIFISSVNYYNFAYDSDTANYPPQVVQSSVPNYRIPVTAGVLHIPLLFLLILATAPISGGHLNSSITFATFLAGYTSFTRCVFYIIAQITGGIIGSAILRGILPFEVMKRTNLGMCDFGNDISYGGALGLEFMMSMLNLLVAFGVALDPRQTSLLGPIGGALSVAFTLGLSVVSTAGIAPTYMFGFNVTRCLCPAIVVGDLTKIWPYIVGPTIASFTIGVYIHLVPPFKSFQAPHYAIEKCKKVENQR